MKFNKKIIALLAVLTAISVPVIADGLITVGFGGTLSGGVIQNAVNGGIPIPISSENTVAYPQATIGCPPEPTLCNSDQCWATWNYGDVSYTGKTVTTNQYIRGVKGLYVSDCTIYVQPSE